MLLKIDDHGGISSKISDIRGSTAGRVEANYLLEHSDNIPLYDTSQPNSFTSLSYDPVTDFIILTTGQWGTGTIGAFFGYTSAGQTLGVARDTRNYMFNADSLDPHATLDIEEMTAFAYPYESGAQGYWVDPNTNTLYQYFQYRFIEDSRGSNNCDSSRSIANTDGVSPSHQLGVGTRGYGSQSVFDSTRTSTLADYAPNVDSRNIVPDSIIGTFPGYTYFGAPLFMASPVTLDDVAIYNLGNLLWMSTRYPDYTFRGTQPYPYPYPYQMCAADTDEFIVLSMSTTIGNVYINHYAYNRRLQRAECIRYGRVPTSYQIDWNVQRGWATYDTRRKLLVTLEPDGSDYKFVRYSWSDLCHPISPQQVYRPAALSPVHAAKSTTFQILTESDQTLTRTPGIVLSYTGTILSSEFTEKPTRVATDFTGKGKFDVGFSSAASNRSVNIFEEISSFSIAFLSSFGSGNTYGASPMGIITSQATFNVSGFISASVSQGSINATAFMQTLKPVQTGDAVGAGTPRQLVYPTGLLPSPLNYEMNPQQWTNMGSDALIRPLYASTRTLNKTANVQFLGDITDLEIKEIWMGGGNRAAMTLAFASQLYNYYKNVPNFVTEGYIQWKPRDLNNHTYNVIITDLSVGGQGGVLLDNLFKTKDGYIHEQVEMTMRIINKVE